jgi:hypothetical protein
MNTKTDEAFHAKRQKSALRKYVLDTAVQLLTVVTYCKMSLYHLSGEVANVTRNNTTTESTNCQRQTVLRSSLFWDVTHCRLAVSYRHFGTT